MSYYDRLQKDLHLLEAQAENLSPSLAIKFETLKFHVWYILPYWNSRPQHFLMKGSRIYKEWLQLDFGADLEEFFDNEIRYLMGRGADAHYFYVGKDMMMAAYKPLQLIARVRDHCQQFVRTTRINLSVPIMEILAAFEEGMKLVIGFRNLKLKWMSWGIEGSTTDHRLDLVFTVAELLPNRLAYMLRRFTQFGDESLLQENVDLDKMLESAQCQAEVLYLETLRPLGGSPIKTRCIEFITLCNFIEDLQNIVKTLLADLPCPEIAGEGEIGSILLELAFIKSFVKCASTELPESKYWIVDAISTHIDVWATDTKGVFNRELSDLIFRRMGTQAYKVAYFSNPHVNDDGGEREKLDDAEQKILGIRDHMRKALYVTDKSFSCVDDFLNYFKWLVQDVVKNCPITKKKVLEHELLKTSNQEKDLQLLCSILQDTEDWLLLNPELKNACQLIKQIFRDGLWDLRTKWFRGLQFTSSAYEPRHPVSIEFIWNVATQMPKANTLLRDLIKSLRNMKRNLKSDSTLIVPALADIFIREVTILRCIHVNLQTQYWDEQQSAVLFQDVHIEVTEAMRLYTTMLKDLNQDIQPNMENTVKYFQGSVQQAYLKFAKLSPADRLLSKSDLVFHDMGNNRSRILITSRNKKVAMELNCDKSNCLELKFLNADSSWHLLENRVFGAQSSPQNLRKVGQGIPIRCRGLPLSIVVIAGVLKNTEKTEEKWKEVAESLKSQFVMNQDEVFSKLELTYNHLPIHMKQCFLYSGAFLISKDTPRSKLVQLWCAERFVEDSDRPQSQESIAEMYLSDLVDRSLLIVVKRGLDNRIRTCRMHDLLREFAIQKEAKESFLVTTNRCTYLTSLQRRLCFASSKFELADQHSFASKSPTRSLIITKEFSFLKDLSPYFHHFKSLFVLDLEYINLNSGKNAGDDLCKCVAEMKLLRYFSVHGSVPTIPSSFGELVNLEVLIVRGTRTKVHIPDDIFNLTKLRYLHVKNAQITDSKEINISLCTSLQRLSSLCLFGTTARQIIARLPNLVKLRCIFEDESTDFSILNCLQSLESFMVCYYGRVPYPRDLSFPSSVKKLTLSNFRLPWFVVQTIVALLPQLTTLKLFYNAFQGATWNTIGTFENLKLLILKELDIEKWEASEDNFPSLERLIMRGCRGLESVPKAFGKIVYLNGIEVYNCNPYVVKSALKIKKKQIDDGNMLFETITDPPLADINGDDDDDDDSD